MLFNGICAYFLYSAVSPDRPYINKKLNLPEKAKSARKIIFSY